MPKTYKVTGTVTYPGGKPVAGGAIQFMPVGDSSFLARGDIQDDGSYSLDMVKDNERKSGAPEGEYRVTVVPPIPPDQRTTPPFDSACRREAWKLPSRLASVSATQVSPVRNRAGKTQPAMFDGVPTGISRW